MNPQQLVSEFLSSTQGTQATNALSAQGISQADSQQLLSQAATAAHEDVEEQNPGLLGDHAGKSFFTALAAGLVHGDGFFKSLVDGGEGVMTGRVAESLAVRAGLDPSKASMVAAAATPYLVSFLKQKFS